MFHVEGFEILAPLVGGALIGLAASLAHVAHGRIAGISGMLGGVLQSSDPQAHTHGHLAFRGWFLAGLVLAGVAAAIIAPATAVGAGVGGLGVTALAGALVGFGTRLGSGCTSGHGVCGLSRLSARSLAATLTFIGAGAVTVLALRGAR